MCPSESITESGKQYLPLIKIVLALASFRNKHRLEERIDNLNQVADAS